MVFIWESLKVDRKNYMEISFKGEWFMKSRRTFFVIAISLMTIVVVFSCLFRNAEAGPRGGRAVQDPRGGEAVEGPRGNVYSYIAISKRLQEGHWQHFQPLKTQVVFC